eukprot:2589276-Amphidinium_carterae.1
MTSDAFSRFVASAIGAAIAETVLSKQAVSQMLIDSSPCVLGHVAYRCGESEAAAAAEANRLWIYIYIYRERERETVV